ncbi:serine hydrolase domain-containing protein [Amycolatopsis tolypomycina]|uniref:serine hydrolase domain-containing protein n=1 Tax=Amycolatopsis tolypomycina TaxID=208445 RepID=UPI000AF86112|nr:serine hydrolase domain-containing protein [Amycolatopsis tolypomycina]
MDLRETLHRHVDDGTLPGAVAIVDTGGRREVVAVGSVDAEGSRPMAEDTLFRFASITKPITAAALLVLVDDGRLALDDPIGRRLPELAEPKVVRTPASALDDVVPAKRPITGVVQPGFTRVAEQRYVSRPSPCTGTAPASPGA